MNQRKLTGWLFIAFPILVQIPFTLLSLNYDYPDILREPPAHILKKFESGGPGLVWTWYLYAMSIVLFLVAVLNFESPNPTGARNRSIRFFGLTSGLVQLVALLRWTFIVPFLSRLHSDVSPSTQASIEALFTIQHSFLGIGIGEHLGQLTMILWTGLMMAELKTLGKGFLAVGAAAIVALSLGLIEHLAIVLKCDPGVASYGALLGFLFWSAWLIWLGAKIVREKI